MDGARRRRTGSVPVCRARQRAVCGHLAQQQYAPRRASSCTSAGLPVPFAGGAAGALYPIAILIDELKHDDVSYRVNSMKRIDTIGEGCVLPREQHEADRRHR